MLKSIAAISIIIALAGCATPPVTYDANGCASNLSEEDANSCSAAAYGAAEAKADQPFIDDAGKACGKEGIRYINTDTFDYICNNGQTNF